MSTIQYTITDAMKRTGLAKRTVQKWCEKLNCERHGRAYVLTDEIIQQIIDANHIGGRPTHR